MSLILVYLEVPDLPPASRPKGLATFSVKARLSSERAVRPAIAITDGVASDRFVAFGANTRGRDGAKLRTALLEFIRLRHSQAVSIYLTLVSPKGAVGTVVLDLRRARSASLGRLRTTLKTVKPGDVIAIDA